MREGICLCTVRECAGMCVSMQERETERECVCVCKRERQRERE
jgi:hypothetical protein